jgi:tight adherence protein C
MEIWIITADVLGTVCTFAWILMLIRSKGRFSDLIPAMKTSLFPLRALSPVGFASYGLIGASAGAFTAGVRRNAAVLYGDAESDFYGYCVPAHAVASILTAVPVGCFTAVLAGEPFLALIAVSAGTAAAFYPAAELRRLASARKAEFESELPDVISRLSLLTGAGLTLREAWARTAASSDGELYLEMRAAADRAGNGVPDGEALAGFASRCQSKEVRQFASMLIRNLSGGGTGLTALLRRMNEDSWEQRRARAVIGGQNANQKLMIPLMMMFTGILAMIIIPLFAGI